jgi:AraC family transcriptional regulator, transcriptional activator of pobA
MTQIPAFQLYGENTAFPDLLHMELIRDRAAGHDWQIRPHRHTHIFQIFLLLSGQIQMQVEGQSQALTPPVALCLPPGSVHGFRFSAGTEGWVISLPVQHYPDLFGNGAEMAAALARPHILPPPTDMLATVTALHRDWRDKGAFRRTALRARVALVLAALVAHTTAPEIPAADTRIAQFQALIAAHATEHWPVARYASALAVSERSLARLCRAQTGLPPQALIEGHVMREASRLLAYTQMSAQSVAHTLGYDDPSYFSRRFRAYAGLSPLAYRARLDQP